MRELTPAAALTFAHDVSSFECSKPHLNDYIRNHAYDRQNAQLARTYVTCYAGRVVGYYSLSCVLVCHQETVHHVAEEAHRPVPAVLMARCAVDHRCLRQGIGRSLVADALHRVWGMYEGGAVPAELFIVNADDEPARRFYERFDLCSYPADPKRMFLSIRTLQSIFTNAA